MNAKQREWVEQVILRCAALGAAALALGLTFNQANPLGLAFVPKKPPTLATTPPPPAPVETPATATSADKPAVTPQPAIAEPRDPSPAPRPQSAHTSAGVYQNETLPAETRETVYEHTSLPVAKDPANTPTDCPAVTWAQAQALMAQQHAVLVDVRPAGDFQAGAIPHAVSLPLTAMSTAIEGFTTRYPPDTWVIVYCRDSDCGLSLDAGHRLKAQYGYRHVFHLPGGYEEWQRAQMQ